MDRPSMQQDSHPDHNMPNSEHTGTVLDIRSDAQIKGAKAYQPDDPKNMQNEISKKGSFNGTTRYSPEIMDKGIY